MIELNEVQKALIWQVHCGQELTASKGLERHNALKAMAKLGLIEKTGDEWQETLAGKAWIGRNIQIKKEDLPLDEPATPKAPRKPVEGRTATKAKSATPVAKKPKEAPRTHPEGTEPILIEGQVVGYVKEDSSGKVSLWEAFTLNHKSSNFSTTLAKAQTRFLDRYAKGEIS